LFVENPNVLKKKCNRLKQSLVQKYENKNIQVFSPKNGQTVTMQFRAEKAAKAIGKLATKPPVENMIVSGVMVLKDFNQHIIDASELSTYTDLTTSTFSQRLIIPFHQNLDLVKHSLQQIYDLVQTQTVQDKPALKVHDCIYVIKQSNTELVLDWISEPTTDMIADSIIAVALQVEANPTRNSSKHKRKVNELDITAKFLKKHFGEDHVKADEELQQVQIIDDGNVCIVNFPSKEVNCENIIIHQKVDSLLARLAYLDISHRK